jgi:hypothetical protein
MLKLLPSIEARRGRPPIVNDRFARFNESASKHSTCFCVKWQELYGRTKAMPFMRLSISTLGLTMISGPVGKEDG